jgi:methyltransferase
MPISLFDSRVLYSAVVAVVAVQRSVELAISRRHRLKLLARGALENGAGHYPWMVLLHATFLPACVLEVWVLRRPLVVPLAVAAGAMLAAAQLLRVWVIATLGERWCTRVVVLPGAPPVTAGPYRWVRHPNYAAVVVEIAALPLIHSAWLTALAFSLANAVVLAVRIRVEENALAGSPGYAEALGRRSRFVPGVL